jgi:hypothetical protein
MVWKFSFTIAVLGLTTFTFGYGYGTYAADHKTDNQEVVRKSNRDVALEGCTVVALEMNSMLEECEYDLKVANAQMMSYQDELEKFITEEN